MGIPEPTPTTERAAYHQRHVQDDAGADQFTCPAGTSLPVAGENTRSDRPSVRVYRAGGPGWWCDLPGLSSLRRLHDRRAPGTQQGRSLEVSPFVSDLTRQRDWMATEAANAWLGQRKTLPEPVCGVLTEQQGWRRFLLRGLCCVGAAWAGQRHG